MKVCTKCKIDKEDSEFRKRSKIQNGKIYEYKNPTCRACDKELAAEYRERHKNSKEYMENGIADT